MTQKIRFNTEIFEQMISHLPNWIVRSVLATERSGGHFSYVLNHKTLEVWNEFGKVDEYHRPGLKPAVSRDNRDEHCIVGDETMKPPAETVGRQPRKIDYSQYSEFDRKFLNRDYSDVVELIGTRKAPDGKTVLVGKNSDGVEITIASGTKTQMGLLANKMLEGLSAKPPAETVCSPCRGDEPGGEQKTTSKYTGLDNLRGENYLAEVRPTERPPRPLVNPKATAIQRDRQFIAQQAWDRKYVLKL